MDLKPILNLIARLGTGILNAINRVNKRKATEDPAGTISNGGVQRDSGVKFSDLASESERDKPK